MGQDFVSRALHGFELFLIRQSRSHEHQWTKHEEIVNSGFEFVTPFVNR